MGQICRFALCFIICTTIQHKCGEMPSALLVGFLLSFFLLWVMMEGRKRYFLDSYWFQGGLALSGGRFRTAGVFWICGDTCKGVNLQNWTFTFVFHRYDGTENGTDRFVENGFEPLLCQGRTFQILDGTDFLGHGQSLGVGDGRELLFA